VGSHRAPKGRGQERDYWHFCLAHVREYNQSYNFFSGMSDDAVARYQKDALTGHRPTWKMGANAGPRSGRDAAIDGADDPFAMFSELNGRGRAAPSRATCVYSIAPRFALRAEPLAGRQAVNRAACGGGRWRRCCVPAPRQPCGCAANHEPRGHQHPKVRCHRVWSSRLERRGRAPGAAPG
jgi:hypothetical protein